MKVFKNKTLVFDDSLLRKNTILLAILIVAVAVGQVIVRLKFENENSIVIAELEVANEPSIPVETNQNPKFWLYHSQGSLQILSTVGVVLERLGVKEIQMNASTNETIHNDWNLLWSYDHHCGIPFDWSKLKFHQKVNHLPGSFYLSSKSHLGSLTDSKYVPKAFLNVEDVKKFSEKNPGKRFVVKQKSNCGVFLQNITEMNFTDVNAYEGFFAMEFIEDPLLFNGHKFDFAVYVVIASINPLRLYYYTKDIIMRFCPKTYSTQDPQDRDRYVVKSSHIPGSKFPGVKEFAENGYTYKEAFNSFLASHHINENKIWKKVEDLIRSTVLAKEKLIKEEIESSGGSKFNFFEMYRFDLLVDKHLNVFLIEINQSPNINANGKYQSNRHVYESVLFNLFNLIGVGTSYKKREFCFLEMSDEEMVAHPNTLNVLPDLCMNRSCNETCFAECELCSKCLSLNQKYDNILAYQEQTNSGDMKRLFPPSKEFLKSADDAFFASLQPESLLHVKWFSEMCRKHEKFC